MRKVDYKLDIDYSKLLYTWAEPMSELLKSNYMYNMMIFLHEAYKIKNIQPKKEYVFRPFKEVDFKDVRVIIIGDEPYHDKTNIGLAYGQQDSLVLNQEIIEIEECIERTCYDAFNLHMDNTLKHWTEQGILPLHASLTVESGIAGSHKFHWREFIRHMIKVINEDKTSIIFMLWGDEAKYYKKFINQNKHYVLEADSVTEKVKSGWGWNSNCFKECNKILKDLNGREFIIEW